MNYEKLKQKLRIDFNNKILPLVKKHKCELCGALEDLIVHHQKPFIEQLEECLDKLNLHKEEFNKDEVELIRNYMIGSQIRNYNATLCQECHKKVHESIGGFSLGRYNLEERKFKRETKKIEHFKKVEEYLENHLGEIILSASDRKELIEVLGIKDNRGRLLKNIKTLNGALEETNSDYRIKQFETSRMINGKKKKYKHAWKIISINKK